MLKIYNSLRRKKETFTPMEEGKVKMYVCGVTVNNYSHIGHARSFTAFDVVYRYLKHVGYDVTYVRNFTDVDDKIIARANEEGLTTVEVSEKYMQAFTEDANALGFVAPSIEPKATEHIQEMVDLIKKLEEKGIAYPAGNDVFYSVRKLENYGKLSGKNIEELESGARIDVMDVKKDPLDFVLWKGAKPGEPKWPSPWGEGRPGWHIECSAMSMRYLGETFDIHGGGKDLVFPHHENEIAQSEGCTGKEFAKVWMHAGHLNVNSEKMSKSLGNFMTIRDILQHYPSEAVRMFLMSAHYRSPLDYSQKNMDDSLAGLERFYATKNRLHEFKDFSNDSDEGFVKMPQTLLQGFRQAMDDDFNTAKVIALVFEWVRETNRLLDEGKALSKEIVLEIRQAIQDIHSVLGVFGDNPEAFLEKIHAQKMQKSDLDESEIQKWIEERLQARAAKDFAKADQIRDDLKNKGVILKDNPDGTTSWSVS